LHLQPIARQIAQNWRAVVNVQNPAGFGAYSTSQPTITPGYMSGFKNSFETEALPGALPVGRNSPQKLNYGLYAE